MPAKDFFQQDSVDLGLLKQLFDARQVFVSAYVSSEYAAERVVFDKTGRNEFVPIAENISVGIALGSSGIE